MASTHVELRALVDEVRRGSVRYCAGDPCRLEVSPRSRLLRQLVAVEVSLSGSQHRTPAEITAAPPAERFGLLASKQLDCRFAKCRRIGACLACTLHPCLCPQLPPLRLGQGHKRERSRLEHPRSRVTLRRAALPHPPAEHHRLGCVPHENEADEQDPGDERLLSPVILATSPYFFRTRMGRTEGGGLSCAAVLLVRLAPPLPALHPGKRGG